MTLRVFRAFTWNGDEDKMEITTTSMKRVDKITVHGRVDSSNADELDAAIKRQTDSGRNNLVVVLTDVKYMSSAGLRALVAGHKACSRAGGSLVLVKPSTNVAEVLKLAGLEEMFDIYEDGEEAIGSF